MARNNPRLTRMLPGKMSGYGVGHLAPMVPFATAPGHDYYLTAGADKNVPESFKHLIAEHLSSERSGLGCCGQGMRGLGAVPVQMDGESDAQFSNRLNLYFSEQDAAAQRATQASDLASGSYSYDVERGGVIHVDQGAGAGQDYASAGVYQHGGSAMTRGQTASYEAGGSAPTDWSGFFSGVTSALPGAINTGAQLYNTFTGKGQPVAPKPVVSSGPSGTTIALVLAGLAAGGYALSKMGKGA